MPFQSKSQQRFMFMKHPGIAKRWAKETPDMGHLPMHAAQHESMGMHEEPAPFMDEADEKKHAKHDTAEEFAERMKAFMKGRRK